MSPRNKLILASASPRRRQLLKQLKVPFRVIPSHVDEDSTEQNPRQRVEELALRKALAIACEHPGALVLGADTLVVLGRHILGKPLDSKDAYQMLYRLSGTTHQVVTGVALVCGAKQRVGSEVSQIRMRKMALNEILRYSRKHLDKAGAYAIQEKKDPVAKVISGGYDNVVGLPVGLVAKMLKAFGREKKVKRKTKSAGQIPQP